MASFSFAAGNAAQLARLPGYVLGRLLTLVVPRTRDRWVIGCGAGVGDGALALWRVAHAEGQRIVWLTGSDRDDRDAADRGIPFVRKGSLRGLWATARARVVVVTHGFGDVNRYAVSGAFVVQLWHGIPLKRIGLDSDETLRSRILPRSRALRAFLRWSYRRAARRIDVLPAASHLVRGRLESAFGLDDHRVPVTGEPRVDALSQGDDETRRAHARALIEDAVGEVRAAIVLYAPTWRDGEPDPAVPGAEEWQAIETMLAERDATLLIRSHPLGAGAYEPPRSSDRIRRLGSDVVVDVTPVLPALDGLVTDYSSIAFDAAITETPVVWFAPDEAAYAARRGFYGSYADVAGDDPARDWSTVVERIGALLADEGARTAARMRSRELSRRFHAFRDGGNARRVYGVILARTGLASADAVSAKDERAR